MRQNSGWELVSALSGLLGRGAGYPHRVLLWGPPGTGKTTWASVLSEQMGRPFYSITLSGDTMVQEIIGHWIPKPDGFVWLDGPAVRSLREGAVFVVNEIDCAAGPVLTALHAVLDDLSICRVYTPVGDARPAPGFVVVATTNAAPVALAAPLLDRFDAIIKIDAPHPDALALLPKDVREAVQEAYKSASSGGELVLTYRQALSFTRFASLLGSEELAAQLVFGERCYDVLNALRIGTRKR